MKARFLLPAFTALFCGYGVQQEGQEAALQAQVQVLEARIVAIEGYLQAQAASSTAVGAAIESAIDKGYTAGINFEARQVLVDAWKKQVAAANRSVPGAKTNVPTERLDPRVVRRQRSGDGE